MSNKRINKAYIRYDGTGRVIPGALLLNRFKPTGGGKWHEIPAYECCNPTPVPLALRLMFASIENADTLVGGASDVNNWNIFFDLPNYGNPFTSVTVVGNEVQLFGGSNIETKFQLFSDYQYLLEVNDDAGSLVILGDETFGGSGEISELIRISAPNVITTYGTAETYGAFGGCHKLIYANLPKCVNLGDSTFYGCETLPQSGPILPFNEITYLGIYVFGNCYELTEANYPLAIDVKDSAFSYCTSLTTFNLPSAITIENDSFRECLSLVSADLPAAQTLGEAVFFSCGNLTTINIPACTNLGPTVGDNGVFNTITGSTITLTVPAALMTADTGNPDGDIVYLQANNTVTVVTV